VPVGVLLLIVILTIWNPASLALHAASVVGQIESRSILSLISLGVRIVITGVGVAAGIALWLRRPGALALAKLALALFGLEAAVRFSSGIDLGSTPPGARLPLAIFIILHNAAWFLYLQRSRRVQASYRLESQSPRGSVRL
jgi:hypothetical protein